GRAGLRTLVATLADASTLTDDRLHARFPRCPAARQPRHALRADRGGGVALPRRVPCRSARGAVAAAVLAAAAEAGGAAAAFAPGRAQLCRDLDGRRLAARGAYAPAGRRGAAADARRARRTRDALRRAGADAAAARAARRRRP